MVEVFPENIPAFHVLMVTADQWEMPGQFGGRLAIPLVDLQACMAMLEIPATRENALRVFGIVKAARAVKFDQLQAAHGAVPRKPGKG